MFKKDELKKKDETKPECGHPYTKSRENIKFKYQKVIQEGPECGLYRDCDASDPLLLYGEVTHEGFCIGCGNYRMWKELINQTGIDAIKECSKNRGRK